MQKRCQSISQFLPKEKEEGSGHQVSRPDQKDPAAKKQSAKENQLVVQHYMKFPLEHNAD